MSRITNWSKDSEAPKLEYHNRETHARAILSRTPSTHRAKWRGVILAEGYPIWSSAFETKEAKTFREKLRQKPTPTLTCPECPNDDVLTGEKSASNGAVQRWFDCPACGYSARSEFIYPAER